jgi:ssRNA-specific RNase YbeY (16S rRNA maturation enzyme)
LVGYDDRTARDHERMHARQEEYVEHIFGQKYARH